MSFRRFYLLLLAAGTILAAISCAGPATAPKAGLNIVATTGTQPGSVTFGIGVKTKPKTGYLFAYDNPSDAAATLSVATSQRRR